jgi:4-amino-4-deoxy-L-arabinose transferase-like glycosyltransferase
MPVIAAALIALIAATALLAASSLRLESAVSMLLAAYLVALTEVVLLTTVLSPFRAVTRTGLALGESALLVFAFGVWWLRGRPRPPAAARQVARQIARDPVAAILLAVAGTALTYELLVALTAPPNNWDSLTYHLTRAAAWAQHGGVFWVPNAPTDRINEFQPLAEQGILYLFVAAGSSALYALPQFFAQVATLVAIYGIARRLGYAAVPSAAAALLYATFTLVALEATTAQNDLVAASLTATAAALLLGSRRSEALLAGAAVGLGIGVKLTTVFALPTLVLLAWSRGRRGLLEFAAASLVVFAALGMWGFVRNLAETGQILGHGGGRLEHTPDASIVGTISTTFRAAYRLFDLSGYEDWLVWALAIAGIGAGLGVAVAGWNRRGRRTVAVDAIAVSLPLLLPAAVLLLAGASHGLAAAAHLPIDQEANTSAPFSWEVSRTVNEDESAFGPVGLLALAVSAVTIVAAARRRTDARKLALALALPIAIVGIGSTVNYSPWLSRFLLGPLALTTPLLAASLRRRETGLALAVVAAITVGVAHTQNVLKPLERDAQRPWQMSQADAVDLPWLAELGTAQRALEHLVPTSTCVGALLNSDDPAFLLYGDRLQRDVTYLTVPGEWQRAEREGLRHIVVNAGDYQDARERMQAQGWKLERLGYWVLATTPVAGEPCPPPTTSRARAGSTDED